MREPRTTNTYVRDCTNCGPGTYRVENGVALGCLCDFEPETLVIRCEDWPDETLHTSGQPQEPSPSDNGHAETPDETAKNGSRDTP